MRVLFCRPLPRAKERDCIAFLDFELSEDVRLYGLRLVRQPDGAMHLYAPQCGQRRSATFSKPMAERLTYLAIEAYEAAAHE